MLTDRYLREVQRRVDRVRPGQWRRAGSFIVCGPAPHPMIIARSPMLEGTYFDWEATAELVIHAPHDLRRLATEVSEMYQQLWDRD